MAPFEITRADGRSNAQVIIDLVAHEEPGVTFDFDKLREALEEGTDRTYAPASVRAIVTAANRRLLAEHQRMLHNVRNVGYRLAPAADMRPLALVRQEKSTRQLRTGLDILRNVRWGELTDQERAAHEGTLLVVGGLYQQLEAQSKRLSRVEEIIAGQQGKKEAKD